MSISITDWTDNGARAFGCNATLEAGLAAAVQVPVNTGQGYTSLEYVAVWACRFSSDPKVAESARDLWPTLNSYGYYPSAVFAIIAMVIFGVSGGLHLYQLIRSRRWGYISVLCAAGLEVYGWYLRYQSHYDVMYGYVVQLAVLTIAPTFYAGGIYALFYAKASTTDPALVPLMRPKVQVVSVVMPFAGWLTVSCSFSWTIFGIEIITLSIQAAGGALAASTNSKSMFKTGTSIMTAGTSLQLATSVGFTALFVLYFARLHKVQAGVYSVRTSTGLIFWMVLAMEFFIIIRGAYRTAELSEGLFGKLGTTQIALLLGDAVPMFFVAILLNISHPWWMVPRVSRAPPSDASTPSALNEDQMMLKQLGRAV